MRKIKGKVSTGYIGSEKSFEFFVEDDTTESEINDIALDCMFDCIEWNYWEETDEEE